MSGAYFPFDSRAEPQGSEGAAISSLRVWGLGFRVFLRATSSIFAVAKCTLPTLNPKLRTADSLRGQKKALYKKTKNQEWRP